MLRIFTVDAFTDKMFSGNPAAVCLLDEKDRDDTYLQQIAAEMNLSETAFVKQTGDSFSLRWFTPKVEVELCGHATLASAHILWQVGILEKDQEAKFDTVYKGRLTATKEDKLITLNFPINVPVPSVRVSELEEALKIVPKELYTTKDHYVVELESEEDIRHIKPDFSLLTDLPKFGTIVTAKSSSDEYDFVSRFFVPSKGINEDPVTGSTHCALAPYWSAKLGKKILKAFQASERGGSMIVEIRDDRVLLKGRAITILSGSITV